MMSQSFEIPDLSQCAMNIEGEPAEAVAIKNLLTSLGIKQYDPRVIELLLDLTYRTSSDLLQDAEAIAVAASGSGAHVTPQDIAMAAAQSARRHPQPPSLRELHALARRVNAQPLTGPSDKQHGIKLPPAADCLLSTNYQVRPTQRAPPAPTSAAALGEAPLMRQHYAVRPAREKERVSLTAVPSAGWQPPADAAGADAQPFELPPAQQQEQQQEEQQQQGQQQQQQAMDVDEEEEHI